MGSTPLIAITTGSRDNFPGSPELYIQALRHAGALAEYIHPGTGKSDLTDHYDGFLIPGGKDLDPMRYNEKQRFDINPEEKKRSDFEMYLLGAAMAGNKPVLGICYGMQVINVFFRGTLFQDIQAQQADARDHREGRHPVHLHANSVIAAGNYSVNSSHHQAVKDIGNGLIPFAVADDGIIEGVFHRDHRFIVGVQWHPERIEDEMSDAIFRAFVRACHVYP